MWVAGLEGGQRFQGIAPVLRGQPLVQPGGQSRRPDGERVVTQGGEGGDGVQAAVEQCVQHAAQFVFFQQGEQAGHVGVGGGPGQRIVKRLGAEHGGHPFFEHLETGVNGGFGGVGAQDGRAQAVDGADARRVQFGESRLP